MHPHLDSSPCEMVLLQQNMTFCSFVYNNYVELWSLTPLDGHATHTMITTPWPVNTFEGLSLPWKDWGQISEKEGEDIQQKHVHSWEWSIALSKFAAWTNHHHKQKETILGPSILRFIQSSTKMPKRLVHIALNVRLTPMVFQKFLGSAGSSNGYAPTNMT